MYETAWMRRLVRTFVLFTSPDVRFSRDLATAHTILVRTSITKTINEWSDKSVHLYRLAGAFASLSNTVWAMVKNQTKVRMLYIQSLSVLGNSLARHLDYFTSTR